MKDTTISVQCEIFYATASGGEDVGSKPAYDKPWEQRAVGFENRIRKAMGLTLE